MPKRKNEYHRPPLASFVALWAASYAAFYAVLWGLLEASPAAALNWPMCTIGTVVMLVLLSTVQARLGRWFFNHALQGWIDSSSVAALLSIVLLAAMSPLNPVLAVAILTAPMVFVQTAWLARHSRWAWLWPLVSLIVLLPAAQYPQMHEQGTFAMMIPVVGLAQGVLQGALISKIWGKLSRQGKPKRLALADQVEDEGAVQRLSLREASDEVIDEFSRVTPQTQRADLS